MTNPKTALTSLAAGGSAGGVTGAGAAVVLSATKWRRLYEAIGGGGVEFVSIWGEPGRVHVAVRDRVAPDLAVFALPCPRGAYPALSPVYPPAARLERAIQDLVGLEAVGLADPRPWLDHGVWGATHPMGDARPLSEAPAYRFLPAEGVGLHEVAVGPVHAGVIEPGHFRFTANGETVVRLEERLGYAHKGTAALMAGAPIEQAARLAGRVSGDSTVAYAFAFALAVEGAVGVVAPPRAQWLRGLMAELERLANHLGDIGAICNDAAFTILHAHFGVLRERVLRACAVAFGHRLMMDCITPGGVASDLGDGGEAAIVALIRDIRAVLPNLVEIYDETNSLQDRTVGTGVVSADRARRFGAGGFVGRASGRGFDARTWARYAPYDRLSFETPVFSEGDVNARVWVRIREVEQSLLILDRLLTRKPVGPLRAAWQDHPSERAGAALVEGFRGDIFVWVRLDGGGAVAACHLRDPSWFQWPLLEACVEGNIIADFPLCNKSFNCSYSGHDG
ncbi:MAG: NADH-quinone oxidoreductase subunit C [Phenylobacterium sp.]